MVKIMPDRMRSILAKIERAEEHIRNFDAESRAFFQRNQYRVIIHDDPETGNRLFHARFIDEPTDRFSIIIGDVAHNLRSALDHLAWQLILANGGTPKIEKTSFPIFKAPPTTPQNYESAIRGKICGASDEAVRIIKELKPYKGGNDAFWNLRELNNIDKHRLLVTVGVFMRSAIIVKGKSIISGKPRYRMTMLLPKEPLKDGAIVWFIPSAMRQMGMNPQFAFHIAFGQGEIFERNPVLPALTQLVSFVKGVVEPFKPLLM
jgi:hypothetical protein